MDFTSGDFGEGFAWGVASSAYQAEGAYLNDNKGLSIWDNDRHVAEHGTCLRK